MSKIVQVFLALLFLIALFTVGLWYFPVIKKNEKLLENEFVLIEKIQKQKDLNNQLRDRIHMIKTDPRMVENLARERLHYARANELVVVFNPPKTKETAPSSGH